jgi:Fe-S-cluster containining protein
MTHPTHNVLVRLTVEGVEIEGAVALPVGRSARRVLLPALRSLTDTMVAVARQRVESEGRQVTCRKGCDACCRQMVPIAPEEAWALAAYLDGLPAGTSAPFLERFDRAAESLEEQGLLEPLRRRHELSAAQLESLDRAYFKAQVACPLLEDGACRIHGVRPLVCREYLVTNPAACCALPEKGKVSRVALGAQMSKALAARRRWLPLVLAREYVAAHRERHVANPAGALRCLLGRL